MEINFEMSPMSEKGSDSASIPYSHMTDDEAQAAYSARKEQIRAMIKTRQTLQTPDSLDSKSSIHSSKSKKSAGQSRILPARFTADPEKIAKHSIDLPLQSQQQLKERLRGIATDSIEACKKYDVSEPIYKRTVEWKQNLNKVKEEKKQNKDMEMINECTFEPNIEKSEIRNMSVGVYERQVLWKNAMIRRNEKIKDLNEVKELEECSFKPKIIAQGFEGSVDFQQRNLMWQERLQKKALKIEEEYSKNHAFCPKIKKGKGKARTLENFDNRFSAFLSKLEEISEKIDSSLANSVL